MLGVEDRKRKLLRGMLTKSGTTLADHRANSKMGALMRRKGVLPSPELDRIMALPQRDWEDDPSLPQLQEDMTQWLKVSGGQQTLRPPQTACLADLHDHGGLAAPLRVGVGKTHVSRLAPVVVGAERPVLLIPAHLKDKTVWEFKELDDHWQRHPNLDIITYQFLGRATGADYLDERRPDAIIADEAHRLKNLRAAVTRRVRRWMEAHPETVFVPMSGTFTKRSLLDFHHLMLWALGPEQMPLPVTVEEAQGWGLALDEKVQMNQRMKPGALKVFTPGKGNPTRDEAREGFRERFRSTPGIVSVETMDDVDASIGMEFWWPELPPEINEKIEDICKRKTSLTGDVLITPVEIWRHIRELCCGFYYEWDPKPSPEWFQARRNWRWFVREILEDESHGLDSEMQVARACKLGILNSRNRYEKWKEVKPTCQPQNVPVWLDTSVLEQLVNHKLVSKELIWVDQVAVGYQLSTLTGYPFFNRGGLDANKRPIESIKGAHSCICSISSNAEGRNLQAWNYNVVVTPPSSGNVWEQMMGRTHRPGQDADEVRFLTMLGHGSLERAMQQAFADARYVESVTGSPQKLLLADTTGHFTQK